MEKILSSVHKVRFQDCDPFRHLNNAKYLDYFLNAREDQILEHYDFGVFDGIQRSDVGWVVSSNQIQYIRPVHVLEMVLIESQLIDFGSKHIQIEMKMWDEDRRELKSTLWITLIHIDISTGRPRPHSEAMMSLFDQVNLPVSENIFHERCAALVKAAKTTMPVNS